jgi:hypothetical protein
MARTSNEPLKPNPFLTYRDPETGVWQVINAYQTVMTTDIKTNVQTSQATAS